MRLVDIRLFYWGQGPPGHDQGRRPKNNYVFSHRLVLAYVSTLVPFTVVRPTNAPRAFLQFEIKMDHKKHPGIDLKNRNCFAIFSRTLLPFTKSKNCKCQK